MRKYIYKKIDAFTSDRSQGNPAAFLILDGDVLSYEEMLNVAKEHKGFVSEVIFCSNSKFADVKLTYFSSECEVDFCGHGTIATMYDLISNNNNLRNKEKITIETNKKGILTIYNNISSEDSIYITAPKARRIPSHFSKYDISYALDIEPKIISDEFPIDFVDAGLRTLIVPIENYDDEISIFPEIGKVKDFCISNEIDIILIFSKKASTENYIAHTRVFAAKFGYLEDPATGSGNSAFGSYMLKNNIWSGEPVAIEQGGNNIPFNIVKLATENNNVLFGGKATVRIEGSYYIL